MHLIHNALNLISSIVFLIRIFFVPSIIVEETFIMVLLHTNLTNLYFLLLLIWSFFFFLQSLARYDHVIDKERRDKRISDR